MVLDQEILERCVTGVLVERGFDIETAKEYVKGLRKPRPDKPLIEITREVASIVLTLHANGMIRDKTN